MRMIQPVALFNAVLFFLFWLLVLYAGADHPPPPGFVFIILLDLVAAVLVYWRVSTYLAWIETRYRRRLPYVVRDGLIAGLACAALVLLLAVFVTGGEPGVTRSPTAHLIWFAVLGGVGIANAVAIYLFNWGFVTLRGRLRS